MSEYSEHSEYHKSGLRACQLYFDMSQKIHDEKKAINERFVESNKCFENDSDKSACITMTELSDLSLRGLNLLELRDKREVQDKKCRKYLFGE